MDIDDTPQVSTGREQAATRMTVGHRISRPSGLVPAVVEALLERIVAGEFSASTPFPKESQLVDQYGVSRTVVREALRVLEAKGVIDVQQGRTTSARGPDGWDLLDPLIIGLLVRSDPALAVVDELVDVRAALEAEMARTACGRLDAATRSQLAVAFGDLAASTGDPQRYLDLDRVFHDVIMQASGNRFARRIVKEVFHWTRRDRDHSVRAGHIAQAHRGHTAVYEMVLAGRADDAATAMRTHILGSWAITRARMLARTATVRQTVPQK